MDFFFITILGYQAAFLARVRMNYEKKRWENEIIDQESIFKSAFTEVILIFFDKS